MLVYLFSFYWSVLRRNAVIELEVSGHRLVSVANRGGEGFDTNGTQKTTVGKLVWTFRQSFYLVTCNCREVNLCQLLN